MKLLTAKVVDGRVDVPPDLIEEGASVTILVGEPEGGLELTEEEWTLLRRSMEQIERGEWVDGWKLLDDLRAS